MDDALKLIATIVAGGGAIGVIGFGLLYITKGAIATAIAHAGAIEIQRLKGALDAELEGKRQEFTRELDRERQEATKALESFKSELSLGAEMRRQVASRRIDVLGKIVSFGQSTVRLAGDQERRDVFHAELNSLGELVHNSKHLFRSNVATKLVEYYTSILLFDHDITHSFKADMIKKMTADTESLMALARSELYVEELNADRLETK